MLANADNPMSGVKALNDTCADKANGTPQMASRYADSLTR